MQQQHTENTQVFKNFHEYTKRNKSCPTPYYYLDPNCQTQKWCNKQYYPWDFLQLCALIQKGNQYNQMEGLIGLRKLLDNQQLNLLDDQEKRQYVEKNIVEKLINFVGVGQWTVIRFESLAIIYKLMDYSNFEKILINRKMVITIFELNYMTDLQNYKINTLNEGLWVLCKMVYCKRHYSEIIAKSNLIQIYIYIITNCQNKLFVQNALYSAAIIIAYYTRYAYKNRLQVLQNWKDKLKYLLSFVIHKYIQPFMDQQRQLYKIAFLYCSYKILLEQLDIQVNNELIKFIQKVQKDSFLQNLEPFCLSTLQALQCRMNK